jgi:hypothetical protein
MIKYILILLLFIPVLSFAQNELEWSVDHQLTVADYQAKAPNTGAMQTAMGSFYVEYEMGGINLITTRNLNKNVRCYLQKDASYFDKGDEASTKRLLRYQQLLFNLYELQARRLREIFFVERMRLLAKGPATLYKEIAAEHALILSEVENETFHGQSSEDITRWLKWTDEELNKLADYCKTCKPSKK